MKTKSLWQLAFCDGTPWHACTAACIVGPLLTLINQGDAILGEGDFNFYKAGLTFLTPYLVATCNSVIVKRNCDGI